MESLIAFTPAQWQRQLEEAAHRGAELALRRARGLAPGADDENAPLESKAWWSNGEAMRYTGLSRPTLQRYRTSGRLPYSKVGSNVYYKRDDVLALLAGDCTDAST